MGFRFRKSFKLMPGVKINLSKGGISTTLGVRGASVNVGKKGAHLNTSFAGFSNRTKLTGGTRGNSGNSASAYVVPKTPQPASTRWLSFGVTIGLFGIIAGIETYFNPEPNKPADASQLGISTLFWGVFALAWWFIRRVFRQRKQATYEAYIAKQVADQLAVEQLVAVQQQADELAAQEREAAQERAVAERETQRLAGFEPALEKARQLYKEGLITSEQLGSFEAEPHHPYSSAGRLALSVDTTERAVRRNKERLETIRSKYDEITANKLINRLIEPGMSREQLIDSMGDTAKSEKTLTKSGERETLIYGSKTAGSYFHIVGGVIIKAVVR